ncbi:VOC family protein [Paraferrimonas sp. SM1919]|uniref:VOC family protein n=1 Tax=Paraferrimonas sp. SM1919 TaxID=2662263 RepID=UPI0013D0FAEA|nr:VOC family protein [Paraferrimonas sp. SM1919]
MRPMINKVNHLHVYVNDLAKAADWYQNILGFQPLSGFEIWHSDSGPLMLASGEVKLALFVKPNSPSNIIAFEASGEEFIAWIQHLTESQLAFNVKDHQITFSAYFSDPAGNGIEITTNDHQYVGGHYAS